MSATNAAYEQHLAEDRRLVILRLLKEARGSGNESVLHVGLGQLGHRRGVTRDTVRADLKWLAARDLVTLEHYNDMVMVATITDRGLAAADGHVEVAGVKPPSIV